MEIIGRHLEEFKNIEIDKILKNEEIFSSLRLFKCILGLTPTESKLFGYLMKNIDVTTAELAKFLEMDRSSIQRALQNLSDLNIIKRKSISMKHYVEFKKLKNTNKKGYVYVYNIENMGLIKKELKKLLVKWYNTMLNYIENLDTLCECCGIKFENC